MSYKVTCEPWNDKSKTNKPKSWEIEGASEFKSCNEEH